mmetsp:Transcript_3057/g.12341  ORF Transcript_3057/g.12341 Transcript_3057/m.12341 type:complete len:237 (-) Transcript_3057:1236-1946(-)
MSSGPPTSDLHAEAGLDELLKGSRDASKPAYVDVAIRAEEDPSVTARRRARTEDQADSEALGFMGALPPSMRNVVAGSTYATRLLNSAKSMGIFFGFDEEKPFSVPETRQELFRRLRSNSFLFRSNYLTVFLLSSLYSVIKEPLYFLCLICICLIYLSITKLYDSGDAIVINNRRIPRGRATGFVLLVSILLAAFLIPMMIFWAASVGGLLCATHVVFRNYNAQSSNELDLSKHNV